jgi:hypothetical protein
MIPYGQQKLRCPTESFHRSISNTKSFEIRQKNSINIEIELDVEGVNMLYINAYKKLKVPSLVLAN